MASIAVVLPGSYAAIMVSLHPPSRKPKRLSVEDEKLTVVLVYENEAIARNAQESLERVIGQIDGNALIQQRSWSFDKLEIAEVVAEAGLWLRAADVIVVAARREEAAPKALDNWLRYWLQPAVDHPTAFVILGVISPGALSLPHELFSSLKSLSRDLGMRFFCTSVTSSGESE